MAHQGGLEWYCEKVRFAVTRNGWATTVGLGGSGYEYYRQYRMEMEVPGTTSSVGCCTYGEVFSSRYPAQRANDGTVLRFNDLLRDRWTLQYSTVVQYNN